MSRDEKKPLIGEHVSNGGEGGTFSDWTEETDQIFKMPEDEQEQEQVESGRLKKARSWYHPYNYPYYLGWGTFKALYPTAACAVYASLSWEDGRGNTFLSTTYLLSSISVNFPLAVYFINRVIEIVDDLRSRPTWMQYSAFALGLIAAGLTVFAGIMVAYESMQDLSWVQSWMELALVAFNAINVWTTRGVGTGVLVHDLFLSVAKLYRSKFGSKANIDQLIEDLEQHGHAVDFSKLEITLDNKGKLTNPQEFIQKFYAALKAKNRSAELSRTEKFLNRSWTGVKVVFGLGSTVMLTSLLPMWLYLTAGGLAKLDDVAQGMENWSWLVWMAAISNHTLYSERAMHLPQTAWDLGTNVAKTLKVKFDTSKKSESRFGCINVGSTGKRRVAVGTLIVGGIAFIAWVSGAGMQFVAESAAECALEMKTMPPGMYSEECAEVAEAIGDDPYGQVASDTLLNLELLGSLFSYFAFNPALIGRISGFGGGLFVNGVSTMGFVKNRLTNWLRGQGHHDPKHIAGLFKKGKIVNPEDTDLEYETQTRRSVWLGETESTKAASRSNA